ncbi:MAG: hypothetical protein A2X25_05450 [Chloroflexi bacterium GWB2_49_20]|nr:MAG: hypothetical protein A2X25_05450 [Chloroflexi bacterium GWB2_49_20]OGN77071.1 MAG: hypothetical protein A2X26_06450 [Chloroflexi bacterium GWC2_49_37]OGN83797.1 MAG: hypothetical protein A2X27_02050 [Chloroflexi bacterium GWD2_49_16]HCM96875.1 hypothetical protein [Anaerolineae bacterium]
MQKERRSNKRIKISYYVSVVNAETYEQLGILLEITTKGFLIDSQKILPIDKPYRLRLDLTDENFEQPFINFTAQAKWVRPDRMEPSFYNIGFEILELSENDKKIVDLIMEKYAA